MGRHIKVGQPTSVLDRERRLLSELNQYNIPFLLLYGEDTKIIGYILK